MPYRRVSAEGSFPRLWHVAEPTPCFILAQCSNGCWHVRLHHLYRLFRWSPGVLFAQYSRCFGDVLVAQ